MRTVPPGHTKRWNSSIVAITSATCSIAWMASRRSKELSRKGYGTRSRLQRTSARVAGFRSIPMAPDCLLTPQPTSSVRGFRASARLGTLPEYRMRRRIIRRAMTSLRKDSHYRTVSVHDGVMRTGNKSVRQSVTLPSKVATQVRTLAKTRRLSANRMVELIENGIEAEKRKQREFFDLAERFRAATDPEEVSRLGDQMGRMIFGD